MRIEEAENIASYLTQTLTSHLRAGEKVVWLVPSGSGIATAYRVANELIQSGVDMQKLSVTVTDERYGEVGHANENWQMLLDNGFALPGATTYRVLQDGLSLEETAVDFADTLEEWINKADYSLGMFGIGSDGHASGIKPGSPSVTTDAWALGYQWDDYARVTTTPRVISALSEVVIYAVGAEKTNMLRSFIHQELPIDKQPAQLLKQLSKCTLFTDYKEGN